LVFMVMGFFVFMVWFLCGWGFGDGGLFASRCRRRGTSKGCLVRFPAAAEVHAGWVAHPRCAGNRGCLAPPERPLSAGLDSALRAARENPGPRRATARIPGGVHPCEPPPGADCGDFKPSASNSRGLRPSRADGSGRSLSSGMLKEW
jgi:hypothetical protein